MKKVSKDYQAHTAVDILQAADDLGVSLPTMVKVLPVGTADTVKYGEIKITNKDVNAMIENFNDDVRAGVPIDIDHPDGITKKTEAAGWVRELINKGAEGLWAAIEWTKLGRELVGEKIYRFISPEFAFEYQDSETSEEHGPTLIAVSLTNRPMFQQSLPALTAGEELAVVSKNGRNKVLVTFNEDKPMAKKTVKADEESAKESPEAETKPEEKAAPEVSEEDSKKPQETEEKKVEDKSEKKPEEKVEEKEVPKETPKEEKPAEVKAPEKDAGESKEESKPSENKEEAVKEDKVEKKEQDSESASEGKSQTRVKAGENLSKEPVISATELKAAETRAIKAEEKLRRLEVEQEVNSNYLLSEQGGKFAPRAKNDLVDLILSMSEEQLSKFNKVIDAVPGNKIFGEIGSSKNEQLKGSEQVNRMISEKVSASKKDGNRPKDALTAFLEVAKEKPDLFKG